MTANVQVPLKKPWDEQSRTETIPSGTANKIRVLVVDDHPIVRLGLTAVLSLPEDIEFVGAVGTGKKAVALFETTSIDVVLMDLRMPGFSGIETIESIRDIAPLCKSIVLSSFEYDEEIYMAVKSGAQGYIHKEAPASDILKAIRSVHMGKQAFPRRIAERLGRQRMTAGLSTRERQVLELVAKGLTNKEVANTLEISQFTVRNHLNHITDKLDVKDRTEAIFVAIQTGIITV